MNNCIITLQGAGTWSLSLEDESESWVIVERELLRIKDRKAVHPRVLFSSRKLCNSLRRGGLIPPTSVKVKSEYTIQLEWLYKDVYLIADISLDLTNRHDKRITRIRPRE